MDKEKNMLKIEHLIKIYGDKKAVDDLSLHIKPGEIYGFIGHNGAGKTTTLEINCRDNCSLTAGEIYIDGRSIKESPIECKKEFCIYPGQS